MSTGKTLADAIITQDILDKKGVATLRTSPSRGGTFGQNGLNAEELKQKFDELPEEIAKNVNLLIAILITGKVEEAMAFVNSLADGDGKKRAVDILNALTVIGDALAYKGKALATQEYTDGKVREEASARTAALTAEASARAAEDAKKADKTAVEAALATKVDTPQNSSGKDRVLVSRAGGAVQTWAMSDAPLGNAVVKFGANKTLSSADAVTDDNTVTLRQLKAAIADLVNGAPDTLDTLKEIAEALGNNDNAYGALVATIAGKVDKVTSNDLDRVYVATYNGGQGTKPVTSSATPWTIPQREDGGAVRVGNPTRDDHAVPLKQMNEALEKVSSGASADLEREVGVLTKKVANLEAGVADDMFTRDDTTAYIKSIPSNAAPYAELRAVGGMIHAHELPAPNLFADSVLAQENGKEYDDGYGNGCTFYRDAEGKYSVYPLVEYPVSQSYYTEHTFGEIFPNAEVGKRYIFTYDVSEPWDEYWSGGSISIPSVYNGVPFTLTEAILNSRIDFYCASHYDGTIDRAQTETFSNISLREEANVRYLTDAKVTALDIYGKNLYNGGFGGNACATEENGVLTMTKSSGGNRFTRQWTPPIPIAEASFSVNVLEHRLATFLAAVVTYENGEYAYPTIVDWGEGIGHHTSKLNARSDGAKIKHIEFYIQNEGEDIGASIKLTDIAIFPTATPTDTTFSPYHKTTFAIPAAVQAIDGYGWGISDKVHNGIEWDENGKPVYVKRVERLVFNGTENWLSSDTSNAEKWRKTVMLQSRAYTEGASYLPRAVCNYYNPNTAGNNYSCKESVVPSGDRMYVYDEEYNTNDISLWKAHLAELYQKGDPLTVYYELAEPIVTDISHLITQDNLIPVEGGGVVVANNENEEAAPTTIIYPLMA